MVASLGAAGVSHVARLNQRIDIRLKPQYPGPSWILRLYAREQPNPSEGTPQCTHTICLSATTPPHAATGGASSEPALGTVNGARTARWWGDGVRGDSSGVRTKRGTPKAADLPPHGSPIAVPGIDATVVH